MKFPTSKAGWVLVFAYVAVSAFFIISQELLGESFIALILGMPWSLVFAYFEYGNATEVMLYLFVLAPIALNAVILYLFGAYLSKPKVSQGVSAGY